MNPSAAITTPANKNYKHPVRSVDSGVPGRHSKLKPPPITTQKYLELLKLLRGKR